LCDSRERRPLRPDSGTIPVCYSRKPGFTETRLRPLARRRERTFWPPWVFMRERNPCFFDRLRRLGWNVRLGIEKYLLLIRSAVLGQTESINQPSQNRQTRDGDPIGDGTFLHPNPNASTDPFNLLSARDPLVGCALAFFSF
jgi:hypothetical protein